MVPGDAGHPSPPAQRPVVEDAIRGPGPAGIQIQTARDLAAQERLKIHEAATASHAFKELQGRLQHGGQQQEKPPELLQALL